MAPSIYPASKTFAASPGRWDPMDHTMGWFTQFTLGALRSAMLENITTMCQTSKKSTKKHCQHDPICDLEKCIKSSSNHFNHLPQQDFFLCVPLPSSGQTCSTKFKAPGAPTVCLRPLETNPTRITRIDG